MHLTQNKGNPKHRIIDALEYASEKASVNIFKLAANLDLEFYVIESKRDNK